MKKFPATTFLLGVSILLQVLFSVCPPLMDFLSFHPSQGPLGWAGIITYQVSHGSWSHLIGNFKFGLPFMLYLEYRLGRKQFLEFYFICGIASALLNLIIMGPDTGMIGSSGAIFGVAVGACLAFGESLQEHLLAVAVFSVLFIPQLALAPMQPILGVAFYGHIGGGLAGLLLCSRLYSHPQIAK